MQIIGIYSQKMRKKNVNHEGGYALKIRVGH